MCQGRTCWPTIWRNAIWTRRDRTSSRHFLARDLDIVLLDIRLGQEDGFDLLREIRSRSDVPVIVITGHRRDELDRVVGLELGADDYVSNTSRPDR
jgi:two-component system, OmpR family, response regulator